MERPTFGLVMGGGGSRGLAHIGVLKVLIREHIPIDCIVGTSMGSIVGVLYALGYKPAEIGQGVSMLLPGGSLFNVKMLSARARQRRVQEFLSEHLEGKCFADLSIPVTVMTVDMLHGQEVGLTEGPLVPALLASSAVPGAFPPVKHKDMELADGGVIDSLATHVAYKQGVDKIIAVDVYPELDREDPWTDPVSAIMGVRLPANIFSTSGDGTDKVPTAAASMWRSVRVMTSYLHELRLADHPPDVLLRPKVDDYGSLDFKDIDGPVQAGVEEAERHLAALQALRIPPADAGERRSGLISPPFRKGRHESEPEAEASWP
jgi:NTE family protein